MPYGIENLTKERVAELAHYYKRELSLLSKPVVLSDLPRAESMTDEDMDIILNNHEANRIESLARIKDKLNELIIFTLARLNINKTAVITVYATGKVTVLASCPACSATIDLVRCISYANGNLVLQCYICGSRRSW